MQTVQYCQLGVDRCVVRTVGIWGPGLLCVCHFMPNERPGVFDTKLPTPLSDGFVADGDAPLRQKIFHISKAQAKSVVKPNGMADNFMGKSISAIAEHVGFHLLSLLGSSQL